MSDYIKDEEMEVIVKDLVDRFPEMLGHIKPDRLLYAREISRSQKSLPGNCKPVKPPYNLLNPDVLYIVTVYFRAGWDELTPAQRSALLMHQLLHISPEFDGTVLRHDISDWAFLVDSLGSDYLENDQIPDLREHSESLAENLDAPKPVEGES
jgi:predicted metallopeptidase